VSSLLSPLSFAIVLILSIYPRIGIQPIWLPAILAIGDFVFFILGATLTKGFIYPFPLPGIVGILIDIFSWYGLYYIALTLVSMTKRILFAIFFVTLLIIFRHYPLTFIWYPLSMVFLFTTAVNRVQRV